jgi:hypothetical protein
VVRRDEDYASLGTNVVVELQRKPCPDSPRPGTWAIIRRPDRSETELRFNPRYHLEAV